MFQPLSLEAGWLFVHLHSCNLELEWATLRMKGRVQPLAHGCNSMLGNHTGQVMCPGSSCGNTSSQGIAAAESRKFSLIYTVRLGWNESRLTVGKQRTDSLLPVYTVPSMSLARHRTSYMSAKAKSKNND